MVVIHDEKYYYNIVRKNIKKFRVQKNYTQRKLAKEASISPDTVSDIESIAKEKSFSLAMLGRIADVLEIPIENFFNISDEKK